jgi:hypothetical protein
MALYYEAVAVISSAESSEGSLKSRIYDSKSIKSPRGLVYALITECAKWDVVLSEIIESAGILSLEPKVGTEFATLYLAPLTDRETLLTANTTSCITSCSRSTLV